MGARVKETIKGPVLITGIKESPVITVETFDGTVKEFTNTVAICTCGLSDNRPFCDGKHSKMKT